jgi:quercetin dioxygenase-like cupin family protein
VAAILSAALSMHALAQDASVPLKRLAQEIEFAGLAGAPQTAVLFGDPTKAGFYVTRVKFRKGTKVLPHWHPDEPRTVVVLSGTLYFAFGEQWDESKLEPLPPGTFFIESAKAPHFAWAKDEDVILQLTSIGPSGTTPVQPTR